MRLDALRCSLGSKQRVQVAFLFVGDRSLVVHVNRVYSNCFVSKIAGVYFCELHFRPGQTTFYTAHARFNGEFIFGEFKFGDFKSDRQIAKFSGYTVLSIYTLCNEVNCKCTIKVKPLQLRTTFLD